MCMYTDSNHEVHVHVFCSDVHVHVFHGLSQYHTCVQVRIMFLLLDVQYMGVHTFVGLIYYNTHPGVLIWRYGAACSSFNKFAAPAAQDTVPGPTVHK